MGDAVQHERVRFRNVETSTCAPFCAACAISSSTGTALANLAACLREAAGLCDHWNHVTNNAIAYAHDKAELWTPGSGKPAPGWTVK